LLQTNNFPEITGRLCPAPCESGCVLGINQPPVTIKNVEVSSVEEAFARGLVRPQVPRWYTGHTVAVVGSGPAGLAAAQQLTRAGHTVAVYERADAAGGLLRYGIPEFKMEKAILDRRLALMKEEGTRFHLGVEVGRDVSAAELRRRYDAVLLAVGSTTPRDLPVPGRALSGVLQAMEYLAPANRAARGEDVPDQPLATGKDVVVIGGGDTGADCLGTALRQGARSVTQLEILPRPSHTRPAGQPWPTHPAVFRTSTAHDEGGERLFGVSTSHMLGDEAGAVRALRIVDVVPVEGRFDAVDGTEREIPAQLVLLAMGFTGPERGPLVEQLGLGLTGRGTLARDEGFATDLPGVFVAGDAGRGQSLVVWAIAEGRAVARAVDCYLSGSATSELPAPVTATTASLRL
jgi:glutamate synthase (NADPH/NADH) small chain